LRRSGSTVHVLILTARDSPTDRVAGLRAGADDYVVKPFDLDELLARVAALARRADGANSTRVTTVGRLVVDTASKQARYGDRDLDLRPREYALLEYLAARRGEPVPRAELESRLYGPGKTISSNSIEAAVYALRAKLASAGSPPLIHTRRGFGYVLVEPGLDAQ
jgi:DNA-binding response OmpR family regulator